MAKHHVVAVIAIIVVTAFAASGAPRKVHPRVTVEIWRVGDDGFTLRLTEAITSAFGASRRFSLAPSYQGLLVVRIPTNVHWKRRGHDTQITSLVEFSTKGHPLRTIEISCSINDLAACATQTLHTADDIAARWR